MSDAERDEDVAAECVVLCRYLTGRPPPEYVQVQYLKAHANAAPRFVPADPIRDAFLVRMARAGPGATAFADAYAAAFARRSVLRKKLILLLAILESTAPTYVWVDSVTTESRFLFVVRAACAASAFVVRALAVAIVVLPLSFGHALLARIRGVHSAGAP